MIEVHGSWIAVALNGDSEMFCVALFQGGHVGCTLWQLVLVGRI